MKQELTNRKKNIKQLDLYNMSICRSVIHLRFLLYFNFRLWHINFNVSFYSYAFARGGEMSGNK